MPSISEDTVIRLLGIALTGKVCQMPDNIPWKEVITEASEQGVLGICFDAFEILPTDLRPDIDSLMAWLGQTCCIEEQNRQNFQSACELADRWNESCIKTIVLKGFSLCQYYPIPNHRFSGDLDVFLDNYEEGNSVVVGMGLYVDRGQYKHSKFEFKGLSVENHRYCISLRGDSNAKRIEVCLENLLNKEVSIAINDTSLLCPPPLFNMLFVTIHNLNHFLYEKITLRHISDWVVLKKAYKGSSDWERYKNIVKEYGLETFAHSMDDLANYVCGEISFDELSRKDRLLLADIFSSNVKGNFDTSFSSRLRGLKNIWSSRWKYVEFTDQNAVIHSLNVVWGFIFDRNPSIDNRN